VLSFLFGQAAPDAMELLGSEGVMQALGTDRAAYAHRLGASHIEL